MHKGVFTSKDEGPGKGEGLIGHESEKGSDFFVQIPFWEWKILTVCGETEGFGWEKGIGGSMLGDVEIV